MKHAYVLVANRSHAKIYAAPTPVGPLRQVASLEHDASRAKRRDLVSTERGRLHDMADSHRSATDHPDPRDNEADLFARELVDRLETGRNKGAFDRVYIVAAPEMLGRLRDLCPAPLASMIRKEFHKNLAGHDAAKIRDELPERL